MLNVLSDILYVTYVFLYSYFGLDCCWIEHFGHDSEFIIILSLYYTCNHSVRIIWRLLVRLAIQIH